VGEAELALMRADAILLNMARGAVVDKNALERTLAEGRLGGVGLDVHWDEPGCVYSQLTYHKGGDESRHVESGRTQRETRWKRRW
jgi:lactate dehydrogenase-like 2-hydroxyacid dehydrogenase